MGNYSDRLRRRISTRGPKEGYCVICGDYGKLTRDHVPPKKCNNLKSVELKTLLQHSSEKSTSQGGTHFQTICTNCNSHLLGTEYDPSLVEFSNAITGLALGKSRDLVVLPRVTGVDIKPQRVARSVVGHVLAAIAVDEAQSGLVDAPMSSAMREYFLDETLPLPDSLEIYYWLYPSNNQVVMKNVAKGILGTGKSIFGHVIKFLPLGFWLVWDKPEDFKIGFRSLLQNKSIGIDSEVHALVDLHGVPSLNYPEMPQDHEMTLFSDKFSYMAKPKE
ncbi:hypothetical protein [Thiomicrorhabdus cannonii]|uniref:hypothetical protein n=1 Tax=Thiomicrorhabdus cannonii TaxID=2748011 RepID=UPI0015BBDDCB|nr:hypothetical protein [Thiomicrorhabdus cannonii]